MTLINDILTCKRCPLSSFHSPVKPLWFSNKPTVMMVFGHPAKEELLINEPLAINVKLFIKKHVDLEKIYFTNLVKCGCKVSKVPNKKSINECSAWINQEIEMVKPKTIISCGQLANKYFFGQTFNNEANLYSSKIVVIDHKLQYNLVAFPSIFQTLNHSKQEVEELIKNLKKEIM